MDAEIILFVLRVIVAMILLGILGLMLIVVWREFDVKRRQIDAGRRSYGKIYLLQEIDGEYAILGDPYALHPLTSIGRSPNNSIIVQDSFASSDHALIALRGGQWWLEDRQSRNGTTLNEVVISNPVVIADGDIIGVGSQRFKLVLEH